MLRQTIQRQSQIKTTSNLNLLKGDKMDYELIIFYIIK